MIHGNKTVKVMRSFLGLKKPLLDWGIFASLRRSGHYFQKKVMKHSHLEGRVDLSKSGCIRGK